MSEGVQQSAIHIESIVSEIQHVDISVYPNPVAKNVYISIGQSSHQYYYYLYSSNGVLLDENMCNNKTRISFTHYSKGVYFIKIVERESNLINQYTIIKR
ncbi:MAG: T9SS type A sorting domain-containing protein [Bacteroidales bacterium]